MSSVAGVHSIGLTADQGCRQVSTIMPKYKGRSFMGVHWGNRSRRKGKKCKSCAFWPLNACHCSAFFLHKLHKHGISKPTELNLVDVFMEEISSSRYPSNQEALRNRSTLFCLSDSHNYRDNRGYCLKKRISLNISRNKRGSHACFAVLLPVFLVKWTVVWDF